MHPYTFVYDEGLPVAYVCRCGNDHRRCSIEIHRQVGDQMLSWYNNLPGQLRVRTGKRDAILNPDAGPIYRRLLNE